MIAYGDGGTLLRASIRDARPVHPSLLLRVAWILRIDLSKSRKILGFDLCRGAILTPDGIVDFLAMNADLFGGVDTESHFVATNVDDCDLDIVPDHDCFIALPGQYQHVMAPSWVRGRRKPTH